MTVNIYPFSEKTIPIGIFLISCLIFLGNLDFESTGDTIYYANIIDTLRFDQLTTHQAYYLIGLIFAKPLGFFFSLPTDQSLAVMSAVFGAGSLAVAYQLLKLYLDSTHDALIGTLMLLICYRFFVNSTSAEIYIVQAFFIWSSYLLFEKKRFYLSGLSLALAIWITPLTIAFLLWFPVSVVIRGYGFSSLIRLSIPVLVIYIPFLYFFYDELLWGNRGLINEDQRRHLDLIQGGMNFFMYQFKHYSVLNALLIPALFYLRKERNLLWLSLVVIIPNFYVISQLRSEDNVFILPLDVFFVAWFCIGWKVLREKRLNWIAVFFLSLQGFYFALTVQPFIRHSNKSYGDEMRSIGQIVDDTDKAILFTDWTRRMAFVYYNREKPYYPIEQGYWFNKSFDVSHFTTHYANNKLYTPEDFSDHKTLFVLESWKYSPHANLFLSSSILHQRFENKSKRLKVEKFFNVECKPIYTGLHILYQCH